MIIDKDNFLKTVYKSEMNQQNINVDLASDGLEGLEIIKKNKPDLVVTELILPRLNGFDFLAKIKKDKKLKSIKVMVVSELGQQCDIDEAMKLGAVKYLPKDLYSQNQVVEEILNILMTG